MDYEIVGQGKSAQNELMDLNPDSILTIASKANEMVAALKTIMTAALAITTEKDWCLIGGSPYLQESGATKVGRLFGVSWKTYDPEIESDDKGYRTFIFKGEFSMGNASIEAEGSRSMKDDFFSRGKDIQGKPKIKSPDEIDVRDVRLAAYTSCINNGVKRLVPGLRNITVETLQDSGLDTSKIKSYSFNGSAPTEMSEDAQKQKDEIVYMLKEMCGESKWQKGLEKLTSFTGRDGSEVAGKTDVNKLSEKMVSVTHKKVKTEFDKWKAGQQ